MRWLGLFTNKTFRKYRKLIFPHWDFIICIVSLAIVHPHFVILFLPSAFFHPHFIIRIFPSAFYHPPSAIRHPPPSGPHFTETPIRWPNDAVVRKSSIRKLPIQGWRRRSRKNVYLLKIEANSFRDSSQDIVRIQRVIWDHLLAFKGEIIQRQALFSLLCRTPNN